MAWKGLRFRFVEMLFDRDRQLGMTEKVMQRIRKWNMRFDARVVKILDHPDR